MHSPRTPASWSDKKLTTIVRLPARVAVKEAVAFASFLEAIGPLKKDGNIDMGSANQQVEGRDTLSMQRLYGDGNVNTRK